MQIENLHEPKLLWKNLENNISVTNFSSTAQSGGFSSSQIYVKRYEALIKDPKKKITVFLLHDIGQYHGRFNYLINWTRARNPGVSFVAMDFVGHGLSSGTRGHFDKFDQLVSDFLYLLTMMEKDHSENEKWMVLGHGMGGLVALDLLNRIQLTVENRIDGLVLSNFILKITSTFLHLEEQIMAGLGGFKKLIAHSRPHRLNLGEEILSNPDAILKYEQDPLVVHRPTLNSIREIQKKIANIYQDSYFLEKPLMILQSEMGTLVQSNGIDYFAKGIKKNLLTEKKYSLMKHDLYNEIERVRVFEDIMDWMKIYEN
ncbi:MAG: alpha/beta hydrolase [Bacteriovorax sp.]|nr:alpha/beta hydrolase [Bacteriovorax sp.]